MGGPGLGGGGGKELGQGNPPDHMEEPTVKGPIRRVSKASPSGVFM